ncbi:PadR family transcriptional regulator [Pseudomonas hormoni]
MTDKDLYGGLIRLHILHHAAEKPVFGLGIIEELQRHGYELSAGTVYPMLHGLEKKGYLTSRHERTGRRERRVYEITEQGQVALVEARAKVKCSGLMKPDTHLGENARHIEVSDDQATSCLFR